MRRLLDILAGIVQGAIGAALVLAVVFAVWG